MYTTSSKDAQMAIPFLYTFIQYNKVILLLAVPLSLYLFDASFFCSESIRLVNQIPSPGSSRRANTMRARTAVNGPRPAGIHCRTWPVHWRPRYPHGATDHKTDRPGAGLTGSRPSLLYLRHRLYCRAASCCTVDAGLWL